MSFDVARRLAQRLGRSGIPTATYRSHSGKSLKVEALKEGAYYAWNEDHEYFFGGQAALEKHLRRNGYEQDS